MSVYSQFESLNLALVLCKMSVVKPLVKGLQDKINSHVLFKKEHIRVLFQGKKTLESGFNKLL